MARKPRNVHFLLSYDNPREKKINGIIETNTAGMTLKEYICSLIEKEEISERLGRIEKLLACADLSKHSEPDIGQNEFVDESNENRENAIDAETVDDDVMDFLSGL